MDVANKVVFITGGLGGIGLNLAKEFLKANARAVTIVDVHITNKEAIAEEFNKVFGKNKILILKVDITNQTETENAFKETISAFKNLDIVVNCAGIWSKDWEKEVDINYKGTYKTFLLAFETYLPKYKSEEDALIINISSIGGISPLPTAINYGATKAALISLGRSYSYDYFYKKFKVKVMTVCPGLTLTPILQNFIFDEDLKSFLPNFEKQTPEELAYRIVKQIKNFNNGDIFSIEGDKTYKINFPARENIRELVQ